MSAVPEFEHSERILGFAQRRNQHTGKAVAKQQGAFGRIATQIADMRLGHDARGERVLRRREVPYVVVALIMRAGARSFAEHPVRIEGGEGDLVDVHAVRGRGEGGLQILRTAAARERGRDRTHGRGRARVREAGCHHRCACLPAGTDRHI